MTKLDELGNGTLLSFIPGVTERDINYEVTSHLFEFIEGERIRLQYDSKPKDWIARCRV
jgi:hypothetical protein